MVTVNEQHRERARTAAQLAAENPTLTRELALESDTGHFKVGTGTWNSLPYADASSLPDFAAGDPTEVDLATVGATTTLTLLDDIARLVFQFRVNQYYVNGAGTGNNQGLTQSLLCYTPMVLRAGTIDRIGTEVTVAAALNTLRMGIYADDGNGFPGSRIAEGTSGADTYPLDATATGARTAAIAATIPRNGLYWLAFVLQGGTGASVQSVTGGLFSPLPLGTSVPSGTSAWASRTEAAVTGAIPSTATISNTPSAIRCRIHIRYST